MRPGVRRAGLAKAEPGADTGLRRAQRAALIGFLTAVLALAPTCLNRGRPERPAA